MCKEFGIWKIGMKLEKITTVKIDDDDFIVEEKEELLIDDGDSND